MAEPQVLYFMLNEFTGLIKIGVSNDVEYRRQCLEYACGVDLKVLKFVPGAAKYEKDLHLALADTRQRGEWFQPSDELLELIDRPEDLRAFIVGAAGRIAQAERIAEEDKIRRREDRTQELAAEREALRAAEEARRRAKAELDRKREARKVREAERMSKVEEAAAVERTKQLRKYHESQLAYLERTGLRPKETADIATARLERIRRQRERNLAMVGAGR